MGYFPSPTKNNLGGKWAESGVKRGSIDDMKFEGIERISEKSGGCTSGVTSGKDVVDDKINNNNNNNNNNDNNNNNNNNSNYNNNNNSNNNNNNNNNNSSNDNNNNNNSNNNDENNNNNNNMKRYNRMKDIEVSMLFV